MDVRKIQCDGDGGGGGGGRVSSTERERERELVFVRERKLAGKFPSQFGELFEPLNNVYNKSPFWGFVKNVLTVKFLFPFQ